MSREVFIFRYLVWIVRKTMTENSAQQTDSIFSSTTSRAHPGAVSLRDTQHSCDSSVLCILCCACSASWKKNRVVIPHSNCKPAGRCRLQPPRRRISSIPADSPSFLFVGCAAFKLCSAIIARHGGSNVINDGDDVVVKSSPLLVRKGKHGLEHLSAEDYSVRKDHPRHKDVLNELIQV